MTEAIISACAAIAVGALSLLGVIITNNRANSKMQNENKISLAVFKKDIEELTREVREHNNFAKRVPIIEEQLKVANHRLSDLENFHKPK